MKVLIVPMSAMAETSGPISRCVLLAEGLKKQNIEVATCIAKDVNFREIDGVKNYYLETPMPMGMPKAIATKTFPVAQKLGVTAHKAVNSFDEVLRLTGNQDYGYLKRSVEQISEAIDEFKPDVVYSEFNISAIVAAKLKGVKLCATVSYPTQHKYAHNVKLAVGLNKLLAELSMDQVESVLQLFDWADQKFCFSIPELEPFEESEVIFCGALKTAVQTDKSRNKILVYMGNGTISAKKMLKVIRNAFAGIHYEVYVASSYLSEGTFGNVHVAPRWDFNTLLDESALFINHGGQNSMVDGLIHGVPQIIVPGKIFERKYNADKIAENSAGIYLSGTEFTPFDVQNAAEFILKSPEMTSNAIKLGRMLMEAGGIDTIIKSLVE